VRVLDYAAAKLSTTKTISHTGIERGLSKTRVGADCPPLLISTF
jgi:hypothetical protein